MDIVLIAGLWLDAHAWDEVVPGLQGRGHRVHPVTLPGQGDGAASATLEDQLVAVLKVVDATPGPPMVVGHSAACTLAWMAADARASRVAQVVLIGGFPSSDGEAYADFFPTQSGAMAFPGWEPFAGPDSDDLDAQMRRTMEVGAISVPEGVTKALVHYHDAGRRDVPTVLICPEFTPEDARGWIEAGDVPELTSVQRLALVDLDSGHWPMFSAPGALVEALDGASRT
ncbi:MAG: alpha/beta fold hydrolase [Ornithinimicrobium sp.]